MSEYIQSELLAFSNNISHFYMWGFGLENEKSTNELKGSQIS